MPPVFASPLVPIIDCGATRTSLGVFQLTQGRLDCVHLAVAPFPLGAVGEDSWLENTAAALPHLDPGRRWPGPAVLVLPAHLPLTKQIKIPPVASAQRARIIRFEAEQAIPQALTGVVWDTLISGRGDAADDVLLVAVKREVVEQICVVAQAAGFRPARILPSTLATLAGFHLARPRPGQPGLVLNLGGRSTNLLQVEENRFAARTLSLGGGLVTRQLAENQDCDLEEAERIKLSGRGTDLTAGAMETLADRLAQEMSRSVLHFGRQCGLANPTHVFLTGGGARLAGLAGVLAARLKIPVGPFDAAAAVAFSGKFPPDAVLTDLIGAAAAVLLPAQPAMDLLPPGLRRHEILRRRQPWLIAAALLAVAALPPPILHYRQVAETARVRAAAMEQAVAPLRSRAQRIRANLVRLEQIRVRLSWLASVQERRASWVGLLASLQEGLVRVEDVWLEKLQPVPPVAAGPLRLALSGRMLVPPGSASIIRVRELLAAMAGLPAVAAVESERFDPSQPGLLRFEFVLVTGPAHPL